MHPEPLDDYLIWLDRNYDEYENDYELTIQFENAKKIAEKCQEKIEYYEKLLAEIKKEKI